MDFLSITKIKFSDENDPAFNFVKSLEEGYIKYDENTITIEDGRDEKYTSSILKKKDVPLAGQIHYYFEMNGFNLRLITENEVSKKLKGTSQDTMIGIASESHDGFGIFFELIDADGDDIFSFVNHLKLRQHKNKKIEYEKITPNPLKIVEKDPFGVFHRIPDYSENYSKVVNNIIIILQQNKNQIKYSDVYEAVAYYAIEMMLHYQKSAKGILPREIVSAIRDQIARGANLFHQDLHERVIVEMINKFTETSRVIEKLEEYKTENNMQVAFDS